MEDAKGRQPVSRLDYGAPAAARGSRWARDIGGVLLLLLVFPAAFGFLATFEPSPGAFAWRIGYAAFGLACLVTGILLIVRKK